MQVCLWNLVKLTERQVRRCRVWFVFCCFCAVWWGLRGKAGARGLMPFTAFQLVVVLYNVHMYVYHSCSVSIAENSETTAMYGPLALQPMPATAYLRLIKPKVAPNWNSTLSTPPGRVELNNPPYAVHPHTVICPLVVDCGIGHKRLHLCASNLRSRVFWFLFFFSFIIFIMTWGGWGSRRFTANWVLPPPSGHATVLCTSWYYSPKNVFLIYLEM